MKSEGQPSDLLARQLLDEFRKLYQSLNSENVSRDQLDKVYSHDAEFLDCFHHLKGLNAITEYFRNLYENVLSIRFEFHEEFFSENGAVLTWTMWYRHPRLKQGQEITVKGATHLMFGDKITLHRDYIDGGELLYDHVPLLRRIIQYLKNRMA